MKKDLSTAYCLIKRGIKVFLSDKMSVFFSLLAPIIILVLYVLFLRDVQLKPLLAATADTNIDPKLIGAVVDAWLVAGVMSVACITVSISGQSVMVGDVESGVIKDILAAPVKRPLITLSYLLCNVFITLIICALLLALGLIYIAVTGWYLSLGDVAALVGIMLISVISAALFSSVVCLFFRTLSAHGGFVGIMSAAVGFVIGAYMPISLFPAAVQNIVTFIPGTYSAGIFRNLFMRGAAEELQALSPELYESLSANFSLSLNFFDKSISYGTMWMVFACTLLLFGAVYAWVHVYKSRNNTLYLLGSGTNKKSYLKQKRTAAK